MHLGFVRPALTIVYVLLVAVVGFAEDGQPKAGEVREFEIAKAVKMKFCWIPPGEAQLGSPKSERLAVMKRESLEAESQFLQLEAEETRGKYKCKGFWLGKYPVTQEEWQTVMGNNPSYFTVIEGVDAKRLPVERITPEDCDKFLAKLNDGGGAEKVFGSRGRFVLPHENEWEYACRGGRGNSKAYYFGDALNGTQANCDGDWPFGTETKGPFKNRTTEVGSYEKEAPHPWGLCDMHGNVWQRCDDLYVTGERNRVVRGGSWSASADFCRAAHRSIDIPSNYTNDIGLRVCFRPE